MGHPIYFKFSGLIARVLLFLMVSRILRYVILRASLGFILFPRLAGFCMVFICKQYTMQKPANLEKRMNLSGSDVFRGSYGMDIKSPGLTL